MPDNSSSRSDAWKTLSFRVSNEDRLHHILWAFRRIARPGVSARGMQDGHEWFVVVECPSFAAEVHARLIVLTLDRRATET
jgi:hypothetical protein